MRQGEMSAGPPAAPPSRDPESERAFQTEGRGIVDSSGPGFYVVRRSDKELFERLERREPCYVLAPRQIGKSSLRIRTQQRLRARGVRCVSVDLTSVGSGASADEWYFSIAASIHEDLELPGDLEAFWKRHRRMSPVRRFRQFLNDVVLEEEEKEAGSEGEEGKEGAPPVVIFLDEIDVTLSLPFPRDDFFGLIRSAHEARAESPRWRRLTFCLIGVAAPLDLVADPERTPFNNSFPVRLDDFTRAEARTFLPGLTAAGGSAEALLDAVLGWTGGHPALTQRLCYHLTRQDAATRARPERERVDRLVGDLFLASGRINDPILLDAERRFAGDRPDARISVMLHLYRRLLDGEPVPADGNNPRQFGLRIAGMAAEREEETHEGGEPGEQPQSGRGTFLRVRNRIFARVFNHAWVEEKLARRFLTEPLQIWKDSGRKDDHVLRGESLKIALTWSKGREDISPDEHDFLQASMEAQVREQIERQQAEIERARRERAEQQVRAQRRLVMILALSFALVALLLMFAIRQYLKTEELLKQAREDQRQKQEQAELLAQTRDKQIDQARQDLEKARREHEVAAERSKATAEEERLAHEAWLEADRAAQESQKPLSALASRGKKLLGDARKKKDEADRRAAARRDALAAEGEAERRYRDALNELARLDGKPLPQESVTSSVQGVLQEQEKETERLRKQIEERDAELRDQGEEISRLRSAEAELKKALEEKAELQRKLDLAQGQISVLRSESNRATTSPAPQTKPLPAGQGSDVYGP